jgi:DNA-binding NarL/FixJ family response regulator
LSNDSDTKTSLALHVTPRQAEVLRLIASGLSDKQIASRLGVSPRTVQSHVDRLYLQNGLHKRTALTAAWVRENPGGS